MSHSITVRRSGGPEVLGWGPIEGADPEPGEARSRQFACGLNHIDVYHRTGYCAQPLPFVPGVEGARTKEAVGAEVCDLQVGDRVAYAGPVGSYAERRLVAADRLLKLPDSISFEQAAAMMQRNFHYIGTREELERSANELFAAVACGPGRINISERFACDAAHTHVALESRSTTGATVLIA